MWMRVCMCLSCLNLFACVYECVCLCVHVHVCMCVGMTYACMSMHIHGICGLYECKVLNIHVVCVW